MPVDGGSADAESVGDLGDGGAGGQEGAGCFGSLGRPYGGTAEARTSGPGGFQAGDGPLNGEFALECCE